MRAALRLALPVALSVTACAGNTSGTLCDVPIAETVVTMFIADTDAGTLVEIEFTRAVMEMDGQNPSDEADASSLYLCREDDSIIVNGARARPIERAPGQPVYAATLQGATPQYSVELRLDRTDLRYTATVKEESLTLQAPAWDDDLPRDQPITVRWTPAAKADDPVFIDVQDDVDGFRCLAPFETHQADEGDAFVLAPFEIDVNEDAGFDQSDTCAAYIQVTRTGTVELSPSASNPAELHESTAASAFVTRHVFVHSTPPTMPP